MLLIIDRNVQLSQTVKRVENTKNLNLKKKAHRFEYCILKQTLQTRRIRTGTSLIKSNKIDHYKANVAKVYILLVLFNEM